MALAGKYDLARRVDIRGIDAAQVFTPQHVFDLCEFKPDDGCHAAVLCFMHQRAAFLHEAQAGFKIDCAGGEQRRIFADAVTQHEIRRVAAAGPPQMFERADGVKCGLGVTRFGEPLLRAFAAQFSDGIAKHRIRLCGMLGELREKRRAHTDALCALTGVHERLHRVPALSPGRSHTMRPRSSLMTRSATCQ